MFAPFAVLLMGNILSKKGVALHIILSLILIPFFIWPHFSSDNELIKQDLIDIADEYSGGRFLVGSGRNTDLYLVLANLYWGDKIKEFISYKDYILYLRNESDFQRYRFESESRIDNDREVFVEFGVSRSEMRDYGGVEYLLDLDEKSDLDFEFVKKYRRLNLFKKK